MGQNELRMKKIQEHGIIEGDYVQIWYDSWIPVLSEGEMVDLLTGTVYGHSVTFFTDSVY